MIKFLQGLDQQVVDGEPDGAAPITVAAEEVAVRLAGDVPDGSRVAVDYQDGELVLQTG